MNLARNLLDSLRDLGFCVTVEERLRLGRLVQRFDGSSQEFADAVAALLATEPEEVQRLKALVLAQTTPVAAEAASSPARTTAPSVGRLFTRRLAMMALTALFFAGPWIAQRVSDTFAPTPTQAPPKHPPPPPDQPACKPANEPKPLDPRVQSSTYDSTAIARLTAWTLAFVAILVLRAHWRRRRTWNNERRRRAASLPGPADYSLNRPKPTALLSDSDRARVERDLQAATGVVSRGRDLDVTRSLEATIAAGMLPTPVFALKTDPKPLLVLVVRSTDSALWNDRRERTLLSLRWSVAHCELRDLDPGSGLSADLEGRVMSLKDLRRSSLSRAVVLVGNSAALLDAHKRERAWTAHLSAWEKRVWLDPLSDIDAGPGARQIALRRFPATSTGLVQAAAFLATGAVGSSLSSVQAELPLTSVVELLRFEFVRSIVGERHDLDLSKEVYRRVFGVDPECVTRLVDAQQTSREFRGQRQHLRELYRRLESRGECNTGKSAHALEQRCRDVIVEVLEASRPGPGTLAHLRWQRDLAWQQLQRHAREDRWRAMKQLKELSLQLPPEELPSALQLARSAPARGGFTELLERDELKNVVRGARARTFTPPSARPSLTTVVGALVLLVVFTVGLRNARRESITHIMPDVFKLEYEADTRRITATAAVSGNELGTPILFRDGTQRLGTLLKLQSGSTSVWEAKLDEQDTGCVHAQSTTANRDVALSNYLAISVPSTGKGRLRVECRDQNDRVVDETYQLQSVADPQSGTFARRCNDEIELLAITYRVHASFNQTAFAETVTIVAGDIRVLELTARRDPGVGQLTIKVQKRFPHFDQPARVDDFVLTKAESPPIPGQIGNSFWVEPGRYRVQFRGSGIKPTVFFADVVAGKTTAPIFIVRSVDGLAFVDPAERRDAPPTLRFNGVVHRPERSGGYRLAPAQYKVEAEKSAGIEPTTITVSSGEEVTFKLQPSSKEPVDPVAALRAFEEASRNKLDQECGDSVCEGDYDIQYKSVDCDAKRCVVSFDGYTHRNESTDGVLVGSGSCPVSLAEFAQDVASVYECIGSVSSGWVAPDPPTDGADVQK